MDILKWLGLGEKIKDDDKDVEDSNIRPHFRLKSFNFDGVDINIEFKDVKSDKEFQASTNANTNLIEIKSLNVNEYFLMLNINKFGNGYKDSFCAEIDIGNDFNFYELDKSIYECESIKNGEKILSIDQFNKIKRHIENNADPKKEVKKLFDEHGERKILREDYSVEVRIPSDEIKLNNIVLFFDVDGERLYYYGEHGDCTVLGYPYEIKSKGIKLIDLDFGSVVSELIKEKEDLVSKNIDEIIEGL